MQVHTYLSLGRRQNSKGEKEVSGHSVKPLSLSLSVGVYPAVVA